MDRQNLRYTKYDLFLLLLVGILAGTLTGIVIVIVFVKEIDKIIAAMAETGFNAAGYLAEEAVKETGFGIVKDKVIKNQLATRDVHNFIRNMKSVGVIRESRDKKVIEIAEPVGVIAGIIRVTNPTSTTLFKSIIAMKARNPIFG